MSHHAPAIVERRLWVLPALAGTALICALWQPYAPDAIDMLNRHGAPTLAHWLGTDHLGRDVLARLMAGMGRTFLALGIVAAMCVMLGLAVGLAAASTSGILRGALLRVAEFASVMPTLVVAIAIVSLLGFDAVTAGVALGLGAWGPYALLADGLARRALSEPYVQAARALGGTKSRLMFRHVLPAVLDTQLAYLGAKLGRIVIAYAALAFLGLGADSSRPDWGAMLFEYRLYMFDHPALMLWPGFAVVVTCAALRTALGQDRGARVPASSGDTAAALECADLHVHGAADNPVATGVETARRTG
ncbi:MAG: ABC transporter permease [Alphaproteobacteria bacterium]|nr:ABC transporter permease [Alphaproteobacteria bacterium]